MLVDIFDGLLRGVSVEVNALLNSHLELITEVDSAHVLVLQDVLGVPGRDDVAFADDKCFFADIERVAYIVVRDQYADATVSQMIDDLLDIVNRNWVNAGKGFIQKNEVWLCGQRPGDFYASSFAAGQ